MSDNIQILDPDIMRPICYLWRGQARVFCQPANDFHCLQLENLLVSLSNRHESNVLVRKPTNHGGDTRSGVLSCRGSNRHIHHHHQLCSASSHGHIYNNDDLPSSTASRCDHHGAFRKPRRSVPVAVFKFSCFPSLPSNSSHLKFFQ
jgi:hypothetical protein